MQSTDERKKAIRKAITNYYRGENIAAYKANRKAKKKVATGFDKLSNVYGMINKLTDSLYDKYFETAKYVEERG